MTVTGVSTMRVRMLLVASLLASLASLASADVVVVRNIHGYTLSQQGLTTFSGLIVKDGRVERLLAAGEEANIAGAQSVDGRGRTLLPGLIDAHGHVYELGRERLQVDLRGTTSLEEAQTRVRSYADAQRDARWILGRGWNQVLWKGERFPTARELDAVVGERPALLYRVDGHAAWANSAALKAAGITRDTADPPGGQILRDEAGEPSGVLIDAAMTLVERHIPPASDEDIERGLTLAMRELIALGLTGVHDAGIDERQYRLYQKLGAGGALPMRIYAMLADAAAARRVIEAGPKPAQFDDRLQMRAIKALADGALGSRGAAMLHDYSDRPSHRGLMLYTREELQTLTTLAGSRGWQLNIHAIGDAGNRLVLDTFETLLTPAQRRALRPRVEHAQVIALADIPRFERLHVIASIQPTHATSDMNMAETRIGRERMQGAYAWRKLLEADVKLAGGSDFPVELPNPFYGLHAAVTRQDRDDRPPGGWHPEERLTREEALRLFTLDAAYAAHMEHAVGSLEPGKWADFILIDRDYFKIEARQIDDVRVIATYVAGKRVYGECGGCGS